MIPQQTIANLKQNHGVAFVHNTLGGLCPFIGWLLSPMSAALAMNLGLFSVVMNALQLRRSVQVAAAAP